MAFLTKMGFFWFFLILSGGYIFIVLRERETTMGVTAVSSLPHAPQPGTNLQPGVCSDRELNPQLFGCTG